MGHDPWHVTHDPLTHPKNVTHRPIDPWVTDPFAALLGTQWTDSIVERIIKYFPGWRVNRSRESLIGKVSTSMPRRIERINALPCTRHRHCWTLGAGKNRLPGNLHRAHNNSLRSATNLSRLCLGILSDGTSRSIILQMRRKSFQLAAVEWTAMGARALI